MIMAYCTYEDILQQIPLAELTEITTETGETPDVEVVTEAIARADSEIDTYCGVKYRVPLNPVPALLKTLGTDLALYHLYSRRSVAPTIRRVKYAEAISRLRELAMGTAVLSGLEGLAENSDRDLPLLDSGTRVFSRGSLSQW